jgi:(1->4)-alpha-D-glucan 1-alpha-D-glucosylmutase
VNAIPRATYRIQLNRDFDFRAARAIVPYLARLGISHLYTSPFLKARPGSLHGYDIIDHSALNPEIGTTEDFEALVHELQRHRMGLMIDVVPNHMAVFQADNRWWLDVLENGPASRYAAYFDIEWQPLSEELRGKVLLPILGGQYGTVLERGELKLAFDADAGTFSLWYFEHRLPIRPSAYPTIIACEAERAASDESASADLAALSQAFAALDATDATDATIDPTAQSAPLKAGLAALYARSKTVRRRIDLNVSEMNGVPGDPSSFDRLHALIKAQFYRLAFWRVAADDINYRRFFDVDALAALRAENAAVFEDTHWLIFEWIAEGKVEALRIDHPDGLLDPRGYCIALQARARLLLRHRAAGVAPSTAPKDAIYLVLEKILADYEQLPEDWPVDGTTGYRFMNVVNGLFVDTRARSRFDRLYRTFVGEQLDFDAVARDSKTLIIVHSFASDLNLLAAALTRIAKAERDTCDFTLNTIRRALVAVVACFPVYRTYVTPERRSSDDRRYVDWAVTIAKRNSPASETSVFDFVRDTLNGEHVSRDPARQQAVSHFIGRFQQFTAPVTAKGLEDTSFYAYNRLASLNEVGGDPRHFGFSVDAFHGASADRARKWPHTMLATSTHDNKRAEDVRARIDVLTEMPAAWRLALRRWRQINRRHRTTLGGVSAPSPNDEYLLYQTLLGAWPLGDVDEAGLGAFRTRIQRYMQKAVREAKVHTSWINPNPEYEAALERFIDGLLGALSPNAFVRDFLPAQAYVAHYGCVNSLAQTALKLTSPGVPDFYQGTELWDFSLVDPDNRRPVDYKRRSIVLEALLDSAAPASNAAARALLDRWPDGHAKLWLIARILGWRVRNEWFESASYVPIHARGKRAAHVVSFARAHRDGWTLSVVPRLCVALTDAKPDWPLGEAVWQDTAITLPAGAPRQWQSVLTGTTCVAEGGTRNAVSIASLLDAFPAAFLVAA